MSAHYNNAMRIWRAIEMFDEITETSTLIEARWHLYDVLLEAIENMKTQASDEYLMLLRNPQIQSFLNNVRSQVASEYPRSQQLPAWKRYVERHRGDESYGF